jgi:hypothetical protein
VGHEDEASAFKMSAVKGEECTCIPKIITLRKHFHHDDEDMCKYCLTDDRPFGISDRMLISFLLNGKSYASIGEARLACCKKLKSQELQSAE